MSQEQTFGDVPLGQDQTPEAQVEYGTLAPGPTPPARRRTRAFFGSIAHQTNQVALSSTSTGVEIGSKETQDPQTPEDAAEHQQQAQISGDESSEATDTFNFATVLTEDQLLLAPVEVAAEDPDTTEFQKAPQQEALAQMLGAIVGDDSLSSKSNRSHRTESRIFVTPQDAFFGGGEDSEEPSSPIEINRRSEGGRRQSVAVPLSSEQSSITTVPSTDDLSVEATSDDETSESAASLAQRTVETAATSEIIHQGYLTKEGSKYHTWKKRWFVLRSDGELSYYSSSSSAAKKNHQPLGGFSVQGLIFQRSEKKARQHCFRMLLPTEAASRISMAPVRMSGSLPQQNSSNALASLGSDIRDSCSNLDINRISAALGMREFFFCAQSRIEVETWKVKLIQAGAIWSDDFDLPSDDKMPPIDRLHFIPVRKWTQQDVSHWLGLVRIEKTANDSSPSLFSRLGDMVSEQFRVHNVDGAKLLNLQDQDIASLGVKSFGLRKRLLRAIEDLRTGGFDKAQYVCLDKMELCRFFSPGIGVIEFEQTAINLINKEQMVATVLSPSRIPKRDLLRWSKLDENQQRMLFSAVSAAETSDSSEMSIDNIPIELKLKLVITEISRDKTTQNLRKIVSPFSSLVKKDSNQYGVFHAALICGAWLLEFNDSSLCIPRVLKSSNAIAAIDIGACPTTIRGLTSVAERLAAVACEWNASKTYKAIKLGINDAPDEANCQEFVQALLEALGVKAKFDDAVEAFIRQLRTTGSFDMVFTPSKAFRERFKLKPQPIRFNSHAQIDDFVNVLIGMCPDLQSQWSGEFSLFKSWDRAFWLKLEQNPATEAARPSLRGLDKEATQFKTDCCPFGCPRRSGSIINLAKAAE